MHARMHARTHTHTQLHENLSQIFNTQITWAHHQGIHVLCYHKQVTGLWHTYHENWLVTHLPWKLGLCFKPSMAQIDENAVVFNFSHPRWTYSYTCTNVGSSQTISCLFVQAWLDRLSYLASQIISSCFWAQCQSASLVFGGLFLHVHVPLCVMKHENTGKLVSLAPERLYFYVITTQT